MKAPLEISKSFLLDNGFQEKTIDETYYENVLNSSEPQVTIYVYSDQVSMEIGGTGKSLLLKIETESQLSKFINNLQPLIN